MSNILSRTNILYQYGKYGIQISSSEEISQRFSRRPRWKRYLAEEDAVPSVSISTGVADFAAYDAFSAGWHPANVGSEKRVVYCNENGPWFAVRQGAERSKLDLELVSEDYYNLHIPFQYAVLFTLMDKCLGLHCVTILCGDKVVLLSAPSGTGKTTLGTLLHAHCESVIVNGDFALLTPGDPEGVMFEPTPFCGSSKRCLNYRLKVDRIVFLEQAKQNTFRDLNPRDALQRIMSNCFVPDWDGEITNMVLGHAMKIVETIPVSAFAFEPTREAAEMFHQCVTEG